MARVGADGYATARRPIQPDRLRVSHAHGYVPQTLADLGLIGMGINVALLIAWFGAAARATGVRPRRRWGAWLMTLARARDTRVRRELRPRRPVTPERIGLITLATTAIAFGVHSAVDWTWFVPGTRSPACCARRGRGPRAVRRRACSAHRSPAWSCRLAHRAPPRRTRRRSCSPGFAGAWAVWRVPERSSRERRGPHRAERRPAAAGDSPTRATRPHATRCRPTRCRRSPPPRRAGRFGRCAGDAPAAPCGCSRPTPRRGCGSGSSSFPMGTRDAR